MLYCGLRGLPLGAYRRDERLYPCAFDQLVARIKKRKGERSVQFRGFESVVTNTGAIIDGGGVHWNNVVFYTPKSGGLRHRRE